MLGYTNEEWEFFNSFADWLSAIGTLAAVVISLWLALSRNRRRAYLSAAVYQVVGTGDAPPFPELLMFRLVNTGERPIRITQIGWRWGVFRRGFWRQHHAIQLYDERQSSPLPVDLQEGQEAKWVIPLQHPGQEPWRTYFARGMLPRYRINLRSLRARAFASTGEVFSAKPSQDLLADLRAKCRELDQAKAKR